MPQIKFSHQYDKFRGEVPPFKATLLQVIDIHYNELTDRFRLYDTYYIENGEEDLYPLPKTRLLLLLLHNEEIGLFTSARRSTPQKCDYYKRMQGREVEIVMNPSDSSANSRGGATV